MRSRVSVLDSNWTSSSCLYREAADEVGDRRYEGKDGDNRYNGAPVTLSAVCTSLHLARIEALCIALLS